jgi:hypothetical protein
MVIDEVLGTAQDSFSKLVHFLVRDISTIWGSRKVVNLLNPDFESADFGDCQCIFNDDIALLLKRGALGSGDEVSDCHVGGSVQSCYIVKEPLWTRNQRLYIY